MGNHLQCQLDEGVEEIFNQIYTSIPLNEIEVSEIYQKYLTCISTPQQTQSSITSSRNKQNNNLQSTRSINSLASNEIGALVPKPQLTLDYFNYITMLNLLINKDSNKCKLIHHEYFDNLRKVENNVAIIGTMLIYLSKGVKEDKIELLVDLYCKYFASVNSKIFVNYVKGVINANTNVGVNSFGSALGRDGVKKLNEIYKEKRKKTLNDYIMNNYGSVYYKYYTKEDVPSQERLNNELGVDGDNGKIIKEFFELIYSMLDGGYIRNWMSEEYEKDKQIFDENPCLF